MHARRFSSSKQRTHRFDDDESSAGAFPGSFVFPILLSLLSSVLPDDPSGCPSTTTESDDADISTSVLFEEFVIDDDDDVVNAACSRV